MSYFLAFIGFVVLIVLHEAGHFAAAKAVGMRVERFSLFFGPMFLKKRVGETEYGIGPIPLGGYVKISGMSPNEEFDSPEIAARAYCNQPVWKRVVVIFAGPAVNLVLAIILAFFFFLGGYHAATAPSGAVIHTNQVYSVLPHSAAAGVLKRGDVIVSIDGIRGGFAKVDGQIKKHTCAGGAQVNGCRATTAARIVVRRDGKLMTLHVRPRWSKVDNKMLIGYAPAVVPVANDAIYAASTGVSRLWLATTETISDLARIFQPKARSQLHSIVVIYADTQQQFQSGFSKGLGILALVSLALGIMNLLPFLPLDGGHIFWALAEKVRGRRISLRVIERASFAGIALIVLLLIVVMSNDISSLANGTLTTH